MLRSIVSRHTWETYVHYGDQLSPSARWRQSWLKNKPTIWQWHYSNNMGCAKLTAQMKTYLLLCFLYEGTCCLFLRWNVDFPGKSGSRSWPNTWHWRLYIVDGFLCRTLNWHMAGQCGCILRTNYLRLQFGCFWRVSTNFTELTRRDWP